MKKIEAVGAYIKDYENSYDSLLKFYLKDRKSIEDYFLEKINAQILYCKEKSTYYNQSLKSIRGIESLNQIQKLPFLTKEIFKVCNKDLLCSNLTQILRYGETTGTQSKPLGVYINRQDYIKNSISLAYSISSFFNSSDIVSISVPYELSFAGPDIDSAFQLLNSTIIATGSLSKVCPWEKTLDIIQRMGVTAIVASPTRIIRLAMMAEENGLNPQSDFALRKFFSTGESLSNAKAKIIKSIWDGTHICNSYGMTETNTLAIECNEGNLHTLEDRYYFEVIDPETDDPIEDGQMGELVVTSLDTIAMPLIRYRTGDMVIKNKACSCGLNTSIIKHFGRKNDVLTIGKLRIPVIMLEEALYSVPNIGYCAIMEQEGDRLIIYPESKDYDASIVLNEFIANLELMGYQIDNSMIKIGRKSRIDFVERIDGALKPGNSLVIR